MTGLLWNKTDSHTTLRATAKNLHKEWIKMSKGCAGPDPLSRPKHPEWFNGAKDATREPARQDGGGSPESPIRGL